MLCLSFYLIGIAQSIHEARHPDTDPEQRELKYTKEEIRARGFGREIIVVRDDVNGIGAGPAWWQST